MTGTEPQPSRAPPRSLWLPLPGGLSSPSPPPPPLLLSGLARSPLHSCEPRRQLAPSPPAPSRARGHPRVPRGPPWGGRAPQHPEPPRPPATPRQPSATLAEILANGEKRKLASVLYFVFVKIKRFFSQRRVPSFPPTPSRGRARRAEAPETWMVQSGGAQPSPPKPLPFLLPTLARSSPGPQQSLPPPWALGDSGSQREQALGGQRSEGSGRGGFLEDFIWKATQKDSAV